MNKSDIFWQTYLNLEKEAIEVFKYIFLTDVITIRKDGMESFQPYKSQLETFSPHIADLLVRCCVQIEAISKELYFELGGEKPRGDISIKFDEDCLKKVDIKWSTHNKSVLVVYPFSNLTRDENRILKPLKEAHKNQGTYWESAYQAVKHDRLSSLRKGNVKAFIQALAALFLLNLYYRKDTWIMKYQDITKHDYSLGSSFFAVKAPVADQLWYGNQPQMSESPYVVSYNDYDYKRITDIRRKEDEALNEYWRTQPELYEPEFIDRLHEAYDREKANPSQRVVPMWELAQYRLNKLLPKTLPFEERKRLFIKSEAWNCWVNQHNKHLSPEELTEDNFQKEIDNVGIYWGMDLTKRFQRLEWLTLAMNGEICKVYIPI